MAWMPPSISEIEPHLFIGNVSSSMNRDTLRDNDITAIVSLLDGPYAKWNNPENRKLVPQAHHLFVPCLDNSTMDILARMSDICDFIDRQLGNPGPARSSSSISLERHVQEEHSNKPIEEPSRASVLVHCQLGVSRSSAVVIAYLMRKHRKGLDSTLCEVKEKRKIKPSENFLDQLRVWEAVEYQVWKDKEKKIPKEPYQTYLDRRAVRLKAMRLTGNEPIGITSL